jgi:cytochrome P450 family 110
VNLTKIGCFLSFKGRKFMKLPNFVPTPAPVQIFRWMVSLMSYMEECAERYGDIFTLRVGNHFTPVVFVSNPQALQQILTGDTKHFEAPGEMNSFLKPLHGKNSVLTLSGLRHQRQRQLLLPPFHGERMRTYGQVMYDVAEQVISQLPINKTFDVRSATREITLRVMMQAVFGLYEGLRAQQIEQLLGAILDERSSPLSSVTHYFPILQRDFGSWSPWGKFQRRLQQFNELLYAEIRERRERPDHSRTDVLSLLMSARDEAGQPMTDEELRDELMTLLVAGHETTATSLAWAFYWIHKLPTVREKLLKELDSQGDNPDFNTIFKLPYLNAVCCETLRIYSPVLFTLPRVVKTPVSLCGYKLEPGTVVWGCIYLTHQRQDLYPQPQQFQPERFLQRQFSPYEFLPFGGGVRRCIGMAFAQFEMKVVLAKILSCWELALADNCEVRPQRRSILVAGPNRSIQMRVKSSRLAQSQTHESIPA